MRLIHRFWFYFREAQPPLIRVVHLIVLLLVLMQMLSSNLISFDAAGQVSDSSIYFMGSWVHFTVGMALVFASLFFVGIELARRGVRYFYPYLWGDFRRLKADLGTLRSRRLPEVAPGSLAAVVQGLGLAAIVLTLASGMGWFFLWQAGAGIAASAMALHGWLTGLVQAYVVGHGGLGLLHIILWNRAQGSACLDKQRMKVSEG